MESVRPILISGGRTTIGSVALLLAFGFPMEPDRRPDSALTNKADRSVLAEARANGLSKIVLVVASHAGKNPEVASALTGLGSEVRYRSDAVDYVSAIVPINRVEQIARWSTVAAINVDQTIQRSALSLDQEMQSQLDDTIGDSSVVPPGPKTPKENPYLPTRDVGAPQFIAAHNTFDGRGVTIGIIDAGIDLLTPELQQATALDGHAIRKILDWRAATDPFSDSLPLTAPIVGNKGDCQWVDMHSEVETSTTALEFNGAQYTVPRAGKYRIGNLNERDPCFSYWLRYDVNRDGNPPGSSGQFAVLWNDRTNEVRVDTNQNRSFVDEHAMLDYAKRYDVGTFGTDDPRTPIRESVPFVVQIDSARKFVHVGFNPAIHGEMVAGTAAGRGFFAGAFDGVAPGAAIVVISTGANYYFHTVIEAAIIAAQHPKVDLVQLAISAQPASNAGTLVQDIIVNRLIERYGKPFFVSAGNERSSLETVGSPSVASNAFSVGAWISKESLLTNYGARVASDELVFSYSGHGPRDDGDVKPDFLAPSGGVVPKPALYAGDKSLSGYQLPPGYRVGSGTSQASPFAAGVAALLISAARQRQIPCDVNRLRVALTSSARFDSDYGAHIQGSGLVQVQGAWDALQRMQYLAPVNIQSRGPVKTVLSRLMKTPDAGTGLYEREGWVSHQRAQRMITLTRTSGPNRSITYGLRWIGDMKTFSSDAVVTLPLHTPVIVRVLVSPMETGVHSAILNVIDLQTQLILHRVLTTVVASTPLDRKNGFVIRTTAEIPPLGSRSEFILVLPNTSALDVVVGARNGFLKVQICDPTGRYVPAGELEWLDFQYIQAGKELRRAIEKPMPGVWEIVILNDRDLFVLDRDTTASAFNTYDLTVRAFGARLDVVSNRTAPTVSNKMASIATRVVWSSLGILHARRITLTRDASQPLFEIAVPRASESLVVNLANVSDVTADLDLYLFDCTSGYCILRGARVGGDRTETIILYQPAAGKWKVVVDGFSLRSGAAQADYTEIATTPDLGTLRTINASVPDESLLRGDRKAGFVELLGHSVGNYETRRKVGRPPALPGEPEDVEVIKWSVPLARALMIAKNR